MTLSEFVDTFNTYTPTVELVKHRYKQRVKSEISDQDAIAYRRSMLLTRSGSCEGRNFLLCLLKHTNLVSKSIGSIDFFTPEELGDIKYFATYSNLEIGTRNSEVICKVNDSSDVQIVCEHGRLIEFLLFYNRLNYKVIWLEKEPDEASIETAKFYTEIDESGVLFRALIDELSGV